MMDDDVPSFEQLQATSTAMVAAWDQFTSTCEPIMRSLADWEKACRNAGMSERSAALLTMELAERLGWPPVGVKP